MTQAAHIKPAPPQDISPAPSTDRRARIREHLVASGTATLLFCTLFFKALFGGCEYGALPHQQFAAILWQTPWFSQKDADITERQVNLADADYPFLHELDAVAAAREIKAGRLPFFDFSRMLGVPLWGSVIFDFGNPLNVFLKFFDVPHVHLLKVWFCFLLVVNGFVILMRELGSRSFVGWFVASALYLGGNYSLYYLHWIGAYQVACAAPMLLGLILRFLRTGSGWSFAGVVLCGCFVAVANCTHVAVHVAVLCLVTCVFNFFLAKGERKLQVLRTGLLGLAAICAAIACFEALWQVQETAADSARVPATLYAHGYPHLYLPQVPQMYSGFFFGNLPTNGSYWEELFMPWGALLSIWALFRLPVPLNRGVRVMAWLSVFFLVYFYVGFLDAPLFMLLGKVYAPNPLAWRGLLNLYLAVIPLAALGIERLVPEFKHRAIRKAAWAGLGISILFAAAALFGNKFIRGTLFSLSGEFFETYLESFGFWLILTGNAVWISLFLFRIGAKYRKWVIIGSAAAISVGMGSTRVPFYPVKEVVRIPRGDPADINTTRITRLLPGTEYILGAARVEMRFALESVLSTLGMKTLMGYHTSLSKPELKVYDALVSEEHIKAREGGTPVLKTYSFAYYRMFLDGRGILQGTMIKPDKALILKLLGVDYIIDGVGLSRIDQQSAYNFSKWPGVALSETTVSHFIEGVPDQQVYSLFAGTLDGPSVTNMHLRLRPARVETLNNGRDFKLELNGLSGTIVVPYHLGRFFKVTLDGTEVTERDGLGLCIVGVNPQNKLLLIHSNRDGIIRRLITGLLAGLALTAGGFFLCQWLARPSLAPEEKPAADAGARLKARKNQP